MISFEFNNTKFEIETCPYDILILSHYRQKNNIWINIYNTYLTDNSDFKISSGNFDLIKLLIKSEYFTTRVDRYYMRFELNNIGKLQLL